MATSGRTLRSPRVAVYSGGDDATPVDHPLTDAVESHGIDEVRFELDRENDSGNTTVQLFVEYSDDGTTWSDGAKGFGSWYTNNGTDAPGSYTQLSAVTGVTVRRYVRFGLRVKNVTTITGLEMVRVRLTIEGR